MKLLRLPPVPIPGPRPLPLLGPAGSLLRFFRDPIRCMMGLHERYGKLAAVSDQDASLVCAFGPEYNHQVLSNPDLFINAAELPIRIPPDSSLMRISTFLVGMNGEDHRKLRRTMLPLFQKTHLENYRNDIVAVAEEEVSRWREGETLDVSEATAQLALCVSFRCLFGLDVSGDARSLAEMGKRYAEGVASPVHLLLPYDVPGSPYRAYLKLCEGIEARLLEIIRERRARPEGRHDALSTLIAVRGEDGSTLSDTRLVGLANELFIAGHETTACTLAWTLFLLDRHPRILGDLLDELSGVLHGQAPTLEQLDQLPLLDAVVKEAMRLMPAAAFIFFRRNTESVRLGSYDLPPGAAIVISPLITHRMPEIYPEPSSFKPERWSTAQPSTYEYLPFGAGPRTCLGASFASMSLRVMLAVVLQRVRLTLEPNARVSFRIRGIILGTKDGIPMRVRSREHRPVTPAPLRGNMGDLVALS